MRRHGIVGDDGEPLKCTGPGSAPRTTRCGTRSPGPGTRAPRSTRTTPRRSRATTTCRRRLPAQRHAVETIIEDAQHDILRRAHPPTVITEEDAAALAEGYPQLLAVMELDDGVLAELVGGAAGCIHRGLRRPAGRAARTGREAMPGTARGSACSARWRCSPPGTR